MTQKSRSLLNLKPRNSRITTGPILRPPFQWVFAGQVYSSSSFALSCYGLSSVDVSFFALVMLFKYVGRKLTASAKLTRAVLNRSVYVADNDLASSFFMIVVVDTGRKFNISLLHLFCSILLLLMPDRHFIGTLPSLLCQILCAGYSWYRFIQWGKTNNNK